MEYVESADYKMWFLVSPSELKKILSGFHLVIYNKGVERSYTESSFNEYIHSYRKLYNFLCSGQKAEWKTDYNLFELEIGITTHLNNITYKPDSHLSVPSFIEPCVTMGAFCVIPYGNSPITKGWALNQFPENTIGLVIRFPSKIWLYDSKDEKKANELDDYETWIELKKRIRNITAPLKIKNSGKEYNPHIRISEQAKRDLQCFYVIRSLGLEVI